MSCRYPWPPAVDPVGVRQVGPTSPSPWLHGRPRSVGVDCRRPPPSGCCCQDEALVAQLAGPPSRVSAARSSRPRKRSARACRCRSVKKASSPGEDDAAEENPEPPVGQAVVVLRMPRIMVHDLVHCLGLYRRLLHLAHLSSPSRWGDRVWPRRRLRTIGLRAGGRCGRRARMRSRTSA